MTLSLGLPCLREGLCFSFYKSPHASCLGMIEWLTIQQNGPTADSFGEDSEMETSQKSEDILMTKRRENSIRFPAHALLS